MAMDNTVRTCLLFLSFVVAIAGLYVTRDLITPFALAIFIWLIIDAFARWIDNLSSKLPYWFALTVAIFTVVAGLIGVVTIVASTVGDMKSQSEQYGVRLNEIFTWVDGLLGSLFGMFGQADFSLMRLVEDINFQDVISRTLLELGGSVGSVSSNFMLIAIYVAFLFAAQSSFPKKMDDLFPNESRRAQAGKVGMRIRHSIEKYLGVQTVISLMQTVVSFAVMKAIGLENALFWSLVIFIFNYIPIIGGLVAVALPVTFALVQFTTFTPIIILASGLFGAQFIIGNTIQPKMMGDSMNLSALVVVLSLTLWSALWGGVGAFLSAPLTVIIMIILAQFPTTRWLAVLLSADGQPDLDPNEKAAKNAQPSM